MEVIPVTSSACLGAFVPIPTLPDLSTRRRSTLSVLNTSGLPLVVPRKLLALPLLPSESHGNTAASPFSSGPWAWATLAGAKLALLNKSTPATARELKTNPMRNLPFILSSFGTWRRIVAAIWVVWLGQLGIVRGCGLRQWLLAT